MVLPRREQEACYILPMRPSTTQPRSADAGAVQALVPAAGGSADVSTRTSIGASQLLRRSDLRLQGEVVPRRGRVIANAALVMPFWASMAMQAVQHLMKGGPAWVDSMYYPMAALGVQAIPIVFFRQWRRLFERAALWLVARVRNRAEHPVRVVGTVRASCCFLSAVAQRPCVLARYRGGKTRRDRADETRGLDFTLACDDGRELAVRMLEHVYLDESAPRPRAEELAESTVSPGDRVEIAAVQTEEVDPGADRVGLRDPPLRVVLFGAEDAPMIVRPLAHHDRRILRRSSIWQIT